MKVNLKKKLKNVNFWILAFKLCFVFGQKKIIVIDPGHGGIDLGAIGIGNIQEKDIVLKVAKEVLRLNKTLLNDRFSIYLTRYNDTLISLNNRVNLARSLKADLFVSLHCNASSTTSRGMEVYIHNSNNPNTEPSTNLGLSILNEVAKNLNFEARGIKYSNFYVLRYTIAHCPSTLLELGFVTNVHEAHYFLKPMNIKALSLAVLIGIYNYL